jgi:hypothetical protein
VKQWESAINHLSSSIETKMCITDTHIPVPAPPTVDSPSTFDRGDTARFSGRLQPQQSSGKSLILQTRDELALKEIAFLRKQLDDLTLRMADLETNIGRSVEPAHRRDLSNNVPVHWDQSLAPSGLKGAKRYSNGWYLRLFVVRTDVYTMVLLVLWDQDA